MKSLYNEELKFIANIALEFRLSLKNICKFFNVEDSDKNQVLFYKEIIKSLGNATSIEEFKYLVYETTNESEESAKRAYNISKMFYLKYLTINNKYLKGEAKGEDVKKSLLDLKSTDVKFKKIVDDGLKNGISEEKATIIAKYRIKHVISKEKFAEEYEINRNLLTKWEKLITNENLNKKIDILNSYLHDSFIYKQKKRVR